MEGAMIRYRRWIIKCRRSSNVQCSKRAIGSVRTLIPAFARRYPEKSTMPRLLRKFLGLILLITTIGLSTCQSMLEAAPVRADHAAGSVAAAHWLEQRELECA